MDIRPLITLGLLTLFFAYAGYWTSHEIRKMKTNPIAIAHVRNSDVYQITSADHICFVYEKSISCLDMP